MPPSVVRLDLAPAPTDEPYAPPTVHTVVGIPVDPSPDAPRWRTNADTYDVRRVRFEARLGPPAVHVQRDDTLRVNVPGSGFDPRRVNAVDVSLVTRHPQKVRVELVRDGKPAWRSGTRSSEGGWVPEELSISVPPLEDDRPVDGILIEFPARYLRGERVPPNNGQVLAIMGVAARHRPAAARLPDPASGPRMITVGGESRPSLGLVDGRPLVSRCVAPPDCRLELEFARPEWADPGSGLRVVVTDVGPEGEGELLGLVFDRSEVAEDVDTDSWSRASLNLARWAGRELEVRFEAVTAQGEPALLLAVPRLTRIREGPRTVLLVTSDTHRADHVGAARDGVGVRTPALDALAARGLLFEDCVSSANLTNPGHIGVLTGLSPRDSGVLDNVTPVSTAAVTLAERFRDAGYLTWAAVSAHHLSDRLSGLGQGFDRMTAPRDVQRTSAETLAVLDDWWPDAEGRDLFLWVHVFDAHGPYEEHAEVTGLYYPPDRDPFDPALPLPDPPVPQAGLEDVRDPEFPAALYRGEVTWQDARLARLLGAMPRHDPLIAFTADHGEALLERRAWFTHGELFPATLRVPLVLAGPGVPRGRSDAPVSTLDVGRTLLDLAGLEDAPFPGSNLVTRADRTASAASPRFALASAGQVAGVLADRWFLALHLVGHLPGNLPPQVPRHTVELFDLEADPDCRDDVSADHPDVARRLRALVVGWLGEAQPLASSGAAVDESALAGLRELGYVGAELGGAELARVEPDCPCPRCARWR